MMYKFPSATGFKLSTRSTHISNKFFSIFHPFDGKNKPEINILGPTIPSIGEKGEAARQMRML